MQYSNVRPEMSRSARTHARKPDAMPRQVKFTYQIVVAVKFFVGDTSVFFDRGFGITRLRAIGAILRAVAASHIRQKLDANAVALVFGAKRIGFFNQFTERFVRSVQNLQTFRFGKIRFFIVIHRANIERS